MTFRTTYLKHMLINPQQAFFETVFLQKNAAAVLAAVADTTATTDHNNNDN